MGVDCAVSAFSSWHSVQASGPVYSVRAGEPFVGHQPGPRTRISVAREMLLDCGDCARLAKEDAKKKSAETERKSTAAEGKTSRTLFTAGAFDARGLRRRGA